MVSTRELDSRMNDGIEVLLLWSEPDGRLWVAVLDTKTGYSFHLEVRDDERPVDVFHHPYAYAARHDIDTRAGSLRPEPGGRSRVLIVRACHVGATKDQGPRQSPSRAQEARGAASDQSWRRVRHRD